LSAEFFNFFPESLSRHILLPALTPYLMIAKPVNHWQSPMAQMFFKTFPQFTATNYVLINETDLWHYPFKNKALIDCLKNFFSYVISFYLCNNLKLLLFYSNDR